ncbi:hypothetical protein UK23_29605 [Lentzea aerocolonigenes]|uniref:Uncharacterized protein n=1 Tax=Lentzea aerocolonigenes TaxID=68170 RepID=A0A0F0GM15_LENAE|nr:hypothetical protein [Lentzea aerocolonigenes]KJK44380.1 hypothetical protein UK23_29605 [Lentzea aerocolonigenes]
MSAELHKFFHHQAKRAHRAYARTIERENETKGPIPEWNDLADAERVAWVMVAMELCRAR